LWQVQAKQTQFQVEQCGIRGRSCQGGGRRHTIRDGGIPQTKPAFDHRLLSTRLDGSADLKCLSGIDGHCSGQRAHQQAPLDALVTTRRAASASSESACDRWPAGFWRDRPCHISPRFSPPSCVTNVIAGWAKYSRLEQTSPNWRKSTWPS
jgi:hypothetical protein